MTDTLTDLADRFADARGVPADAEWARTAAARLVLEGVRVELARDALGDALVQVSETGEGPEELYGAPLAWVRAQRELWREDGEPVSEPPGVASARELVLGTLIGATAIPVFLFLVRVLGWEWRESYTWPLLLAPLLLAGAGQAVRAVHERVLRTASQRAAVLAALGALVVLAVAIAAFFLGTRDALVVEGSTVGLLVSAAVHGTVAAVVGRLWPERAAPPARTGEDDSAWFAELAGALRQRGDMTDRRVQRVLAETRAHAAESGVPVAEEFGRAAEYAARFPADEPVAARRRAWFTTAVAVVPAGFLVSYVVEDGWRWGAPHLSSLLWLLLAGGLAVSAWRRVLRAR